MNRFVDCSACGYVGEGEHFPAFRARSGSGGSAAGRRSRSSTYPQALLVNLPRRAITQALVVALRVVKVQPAANSGLGFGHCRIGIEVNLLVFETAPQPLEEDVVHAPAPRLREGRLLPSMLIVTPCRFRVPVKSSLVNWLAWSVLKISGRP